MNIIGGHPVTRRIAFAFKRALRRLSAKAPLEVIGGSGGSGGGCVEAVYIINLDRQPDRWAHIAGEARHFTTACGQRLTTFCHRVSAVDAESLNEESMRAAVAATYPLAAQYYVDPDPRLLTLIRDKDVPVKMSPEEVAVALSHIKTWRRIVAEQRRYALVLEDDAFFEKDFPAQLNRSWRELPTADKDGPRFDLLYLSFREVERGAQRIACSPNLHRPIRGLWWLSGYVLSYAGARRLLDSLPVVGPVDLWMNHRFSELDVYSTPTSVISQRTDMPSGNRYSILPLLSQIGVQTDKAHLLLEQTRGRRPVFAVGFDEETAAVLDTALSVLGYRCCHDRWGRLSANIEELLEKRRPLLFDAYIRVQSVARALAQVQELYPDAAFIVPHIAQQGSDLSAEEYSSVRRRLNGRRDRLLPFDAHDPAGWRPLCTFLGCKVPQHRFPANGTSIRIPALLSESVERIPVSNLLLTVHEHDVHPWIVPCQRLSDFGVIRGSRTSGVRVGSFRPVVGEDSSLLDTSRWAALTGSFPSNLATFLPENVAPLPPQGCRLILDANGGGSRAYSAASLVSRQAYHFGRFEAIMRPTRVPGVVTAFFLHRNDPWQEVDIELLGRDTTKVLLNVYFNPGDDGTKLNFGARGTPVVLDLPFDATEAYHRYAVEWEPHEVRWFVDDQLIHVRAAWEPTPVPSLPMCVYCSIWPPRSPELAGTLRASDLPVSSDVRHIARCAWDDKKRCQDELF